jgi:hypothetical protein
LGLTLFLIDGNGIVLKTDTLGIEFTETIRRPRAIEAKLVGADRILVSGDQMLPPETGCCIQRINFCLYDLAMNRLDTFYYKAYPSLFNSNNTSLFNMPPNMVTLPTGGVITGGIFRADLLQGYGYDDYHSSYAPFIAKYQVGHRMAIDTFVCSNARVDALDKARTNLWAKETITYNPFDHHLYFSSLTHRQPVTGSCTNGEDGTDYANIEVLKIDTTHLNIVWKKYIRFNKDSINSCFYNLTTLSAHERPGVLISGFYTDNGYPDLPVLSALGQKEQYLYYINDTTETFVPEPYNPTSIADWAAYQQAHRISLYPNPARD